MELTPSRLELVEGRAALGEPVFRWPRWPAPVESGGRPLGRASTCRCPRTRAAWSRQSVAEPPTTEFSAVDGFGFIAYQTAPLHRGGLSLQLVDYMSAMPPSGNVAAMVDTSALVAIVGLARS